MFLNDEMKTFIEAVHKYKSYECYKRIAVSILAVSHFRCKANRKHGFVCGTPNSNRQKALILELNKRFTEEKLSNFIIYLETLNDDKISNAYIDLFLDLLKMAPIIPIMRNRAFDELHFQHNKDTVVSVLEKLKKRGVILNYDFQEEHIFFKPLLSSEMLIQIGVDTFSVAGRANGNLENIQNNINVMAAATLLTNEINCDDYVIGKWVFNTYSGKFLYCLKSAFDFTTPENIELIIESAIKEYTKTVDTFNDFIFEAEKTSAPTVIVRQDIIKALLGNSEGDCS